MIALATQKQVYEKTISNAKETKSRGAKVLLFTTRDAVVPDGVADYVVRLDDYDDLLMPLQLIVPLQLFAYYMAVLRGCDVDKPPQSRQERDRGITVESEIKPCQTRPLVVYYLGNRCWCGAMAAQLICNQWVAGSTPVTSSKKPQNGKRFGVFCCYRKCFYCGKTQENRERQKKRKSVEKVVDKCHFR